MSALIAVCGSNAIHVLTDAAVTALDDGRIMGITRKQAITKIGVAVAGTGLLGPLRAFASRAEARAKDFDELAEIAQEIWKEACATRPEWGKDVVLNLLYAGWSEQANCLSMDAITPNGEVAIDQPAFAVGPNENCRDFLRSFVKRFADEPDAFDPATDGLKYMEILRRDCLHQYERATHPAVGGFVQHTEITREAITTKVVHQWPDLGGRPIDPDASADPQTKDEHFFGQTLAELYEVREGLVSRSLPFKADNREAA